MKMLARQAIDERIEVSIAEGAGYRCDSNARSGQQAGGRARVTTAGTALAYASYLGGSGDEDVLDMTIDRSGNAYVPGPTSSAEESTCSW